MKKLVWVTGASSGIGRAVALTLARRGYKVIATARREEKLNQLTDINKNIISYPCDVTDRTAIKNLVEKIESEQGPIDIAFLNAGARYRNNTANMFGDSFRKTLDTNIYGTVNCLEAVTSSMMKKKSGHIVVVSAIGGYVGVPYLGAAYVSSKATQRIICECIKPILDSKNIKIQIVCPGFIDTDLISDKIAENFSKMNVQKAAKKICNGIETNKFEITFPKTLSLTVKFIRILPYSISFWLGKSWLKWAKLLNIFGK